MRLFSVVLALMFSMSVAQAQVGSYGTHLSSALQKAGDQQTTSLENTPIEPSPEELYQEAFTMYGPAEEAMTIQDLLHYASTQPRLIVLINKSNRRAGPVGETGQTMWVYLDNVLLYVWDVSTGREQWENAPGRRYFSRTPVGSWSPYRMTRDHRSSLWGGVPMPYALWLTGGIAIHGTDAVNALGRRASGGCIRLATPNARALYNIVLDVSRAATRVTIFEQ